MERYPAEELVRWCQRTLPDDPRGFEALVAQYKGRVFATSYRLMGDRQDAEDQAQEVFLKVYRGIRHLEEPGTLITWLDRITVNTCYDALARQKRRPATTPLTPRDTTGAEEESHYADAHAPTPEEAALHHEIRHCLETTLAQLDTDARLVIMLRDIDDRPYQEIVDLLGLGLSAVKMRIHRARLAFQQVLDRVCPGVWRTT